MVQRIGRPDMEVVPWRGAQITEHVRDIARLRMEVFREFPYLYEGDMEYERRYLERYAEHADTVLVAAMHAGQVVGVSTGMPMSHADAAFQRPWEECGCDVSSVYYLAESVLLPQYRGMGIGGRFFDLREAHVRALGGYAWLCFSAVVREAHHPGRTKDYVPLDSFWGRRGYARRPELHTVLHWPEVGEVEESAQVMEFWCKPVE